MVYIGASTNGGKDMNAARRKQIEKAATLIEQAKEILQECLDEEQEYFDNMPESIQNGEKGERAQSAVDGMQEIVDDLDGFDFEAIAE